MRDRSDLFEDGDDVIRLGRHRFRVSSRSLDLTLVPRGDSLAVNLSGTDFYETLEDERLEAARAYWHQALPSETEAVYRAEHLAASILFDAEAGRGDLDLGTLRDAALDEAALLSLVRSYAGPRYDEGYERGVHDHDAARILDKLLALRSTAGLLRYAPRPRALACLYWAHEPDVARRALLARKARSLGRLRVALPGAAATEELATELGQAVAEHASAHGIDCGPEDARQAGAYLAEELALSEPRFATSAEAAALRDALLAWLDARDDGGQLRRAFLDDHVALEDDLTSRWELVNAWLDAFVAASPAEERPGRLAVSPESAALLCTDDRLDRQLSGALASVTVEGLLGQHPRLAGGSLDLRLDEVLSRTGHHLQVTVPAFREFRALRSALLDRERRRLRLDELKPRVLSSFVRNRLIDEVYLPLIGDNLAKQIGALGAGKRTDLMGLLLVISPPGYGKTTLMEYVANRLGLIFVKVNGPALGHEVTSLDPAEAPNATAAQEVDKVNLALEMGNNVLLYLDDIQHTNPELLQKFISLCDATRRIEGVWHGRTRTYDLRGKRFAVCMAGNPYTESGERFRIPDMLANRADTYNLGDVLTGREEAFELSYLENALTSNPVLAPLATRDQSDVYALIRMAKGEDVPASELKHGYARAELEELEAVFSRLLRVQQIVLRVNAAYIASASMADAYRKEPPFSLQGSYRNMNKLAEKVVAVMNEAELQALLDDHYQGEAQTLTTGTESNLLKLAALRGVQTPEQETRWAEVCATYRRLQSLGGPEDDPVTRVSSQLSTLAGHVERVHEAIRDAANGAAD